MKAKITTAFKFAIDGIRVVEVHLDEEVTGRCAEVAIQEGWGVPVDTQPPAPSPSPESAPGAVTGSQLPPVKQSWSDPAPEVRPGKKKGR